MLSLSRCFCVLSFSVVNKDLYYTTVISWCGWKAGIDTARQLSLELDARQRLSVARPAIPLAAC